MEALEILTFIADEGKRQGISKAKIAEKTYRDPSAFYATLCKVRQGSDITFSLLTDYLKVVGYELTIQPIKEEA